MAETSNLVKPPQYRRGSGASEVRIEDGASWGLPGVRVYVKRQQNYTCRPAWRLWRRTPTLRRELRALEACRALGFDVPTVVHFRQQGLDAELAIGEITGALPLQAALAQAGADAPEVLGRVGRTIARLHDAGWSHGALYSDHILVRPGRHGEVFLIDFEKARRSRRLAAADLERLLRRSTFLSDAERQCLVESYRAARKR